MSQSIYLAGRKVLDAVGVQPEAGRLVAVCGPNGAGKTTLLRALAGLLPGTARPDPRRLAYLPQAAHCAWGLTLREVAALGRLPHHDRDAAAVDRALAACGILDLAGRRIDRVSGGQARRALLARCLATEPAVLLLDEPTADLDPAAAHAIMGLLRATARTGKAVLVVLHALDLAQRYADRLVLLVDGRVAADDRPEAVMPFAAAAFGMQLGIDPAPRLLPP